MSITTSTLSAAARPIVGDSNAYTSPYGAGISIAIDLDAQGRKALGTHGFHLSVTPDGDDIILTTHRPGGFVEKTVAADGAPGARNAIITFARETHGTAFWSWAPGDPLPRIDGRPLSEYPADCPSVRALAGVSLPMGRMEATTVLLPLPTREEEIKTVHPVVRDAIISIEYRGKKIRRFAAEEPYDPITRLVVQIGRKNITVNWPENDDFIELTPSGEIRLEEAMDLPMKFTDAGWASGVAFAPASEVAPRAVKKTLTISPWATVTLGEGGDPTLTMSWDTPAYRSGRETSRDWSGTPEEAAAYWGGFKRTTTTGGILILEDHQH